MSFAWWRQESGGDPPKADRKRLRRARCGIAHPMQLCVLTLVMVVVFVAGGRLATADSDAADSNFDSVIKSLCKSKNTEGSYDWNLDGESARIWVICQSETRILASINIPDAFYTVTMVHTAINRRNPDVLSFATYDLSAEGAKTVNGRIKSHAVLRLSIDGLRHGRAVGELQRNPVLPISINATRSEPLPSLLAETGSAPEPSFQFSGSFYVEKPAEEVTKREFQLADVKPPACLVIAIDGDLRTVNFHDSGALAIWLAWGSSADSGGRVFYSTNGVDDGLAGKDSVIQIRGIFLTADLIKFFFLNSLRGLSGPFHAVRMDSQTLASNPCRPH